MDHILLILNHILIIVPKASKFSTINDHILSEKEIEKLYDLKHTIILSIENVIVVESLLGEDNDHNIGSNWLQTSNSLVNFQITEKSHDSGYRHHFFRAKTADDKVKILRYINHFTVYSKCK